MNEPVQISDAQTTKKKRSLVLPIAVGIVAIAIAGFLASRAGLDKALVKQQVDNFAAHLHEKGKAQGRDLTLTYRDLDVVGSFADKHVVLRDVVLGVKPLQPRPVPLGEKKETDSLQITTASVAIYPKSADLSSLRVELPDVIDVAGEEEPAKSLLKIKNNAPLAVTVGKKKIGETEMDEVTYESPSQTILTYLHEQQATGAEEETPVVVPVYQSLQIDMAPGGGFTTLMQGDASGIGETKASFKDITITPQEAPEGALKLAEVTANWRNVLNEKKLNAIHADAKVGPITSANVAAPYLPVSLNFDADYEGPLGRSPESVAQVEAQESSLQLKTFSITTKDASLVANANFKATAGDVLPVGTASIALSNAPFVLGELRKYGILNEENESLVTAVLQQVTGAPVASLTDITVPVERIRGGSFKIGNTTFEELFAVFLKEAMQGGNGQSPVIIAPGQPGAAQPSVPQLPSADKPKSAPVEVPDPSVRG